MRNTESASTYFKIAASTAGRFKDVDEGAQHQFLAQGLGDVAMALRDIYDKLEAMDRKIDDLARKK